MFTSRKGLILLWGEFLYERESLLAVKSVYQKGRMPISAGYQKMQMQIQNENAYKMNSLNCWKLSTSVDCSYLLTKWELI